MATKMKKRPVIITTERRGVFYGQLESYDEKTRVAVLEDAVMCLIWGTTKGFFQLAATGPTSQGSYSARCPTIRLELCECIADVTPEAEAVWQSTSR